MEVFKMFKRKTILLLISLIVGILTISGVSASEMLNDAADEVGIYDVSFQSDFSDDLKNCNDDSSLLEETEIYEDDVYYPGFECSSYYNDAYVNVTLPKKANGNLVVSLIEYDDDYEETVNEIGNVKLVDGKASFKLPCSELISYEYKAEYTGDDYNLDELNNWITVMPKVNVNHILWIEDDNYMSFEMPNDEQLKLLLYREGNLLTETVIKNGSKLKLDNLILGDSDYYLEYYKLENGEYDWYGDYSLYLEVRQDNPEFKLNVTVDDALFKSDNTNIRIALPNSHNNYYDDMITVIVDGDKSKAITSDSSDFYIHINDLDYGEHTVDVICKADNYYKEAKASTTFNISYLIFNVDESVEYGRSPIYIESIENVTGYVLCYIDGKLYDINFIDKNYYYSDSFNLNTGKHEYELIYSGDDNYRPLSKKGSFNVDYDLFMENHYLKYGENQIEVYINEYATGNLIMVLNGKSYSAKINDSRAIFTIPNLPAGEYPVNITYSGNDKLNSKTINGLIEISYEIQIENEYVSLALPQNADGNLNVFLFDNYDDYSDYDYCMIYGEPFDGVILDQYSIPLKNGKAYLSLKDLENGEYYVIAEYTGEDYPVSSFSSQIWVENQYDDIKIDVPETIVMNQNAYVTVTLPDKYDKSLLNMKIVSYIYTDDTGELEVISEASGVTSVKIPTSKLGYYTLKVKYDDYDFDEIYFEVLPLKINAPDMYGELLLGDIISVEMPKDAKGRLQLEFYEYGTMYLEKTFNSSESKDGKVSVEITNLTSKDYRIFIHYFDEVYGNYTTSLPVTVKGHNSQFNIDAIKTQNSTEINIKLNDDASGIVVLNILDKIYDAKVNKGIATVNILKINVKSFAADIWYSGDEKYRPIIKTVNVNVKTTPNISAPSVSLTYNNAKKIKITLTDEEGKFISGKSVVMLLNNKIYKGTTNEKGYVSISLPTNLVPKSYKALITFAGDDSYLPHNITAKIKVVKATPKLTAKKTTFKVKTKIKKYSIILKNNKNKVMKKVKVTLKVNGKTYKAVTNNKGKATFKITKLTKKRTFKAVVKYSGNKYYKSVSKTVKLTVKK